MYHVSFIHIMYIYSVSTIHETFGIRWKEPPPMIWGSSGFSLSTPAYKCLPELSVSTLSSSPPIAVISLPAASRLLLHKPSPFGGPRVLSDFSLHFSMGNPISLLNTMGENLGTPAKNERFRTQVSYLIAMWKYVIILS